ncbi:MAG: 3'(2'),5'-bisphosphate nucleotidase CysQ [Gammaproteobacteria bacterium]|nr:3'(2'),5'-bisphosphate nucleotidase CysQ [Gammaproteobacteria bacterium]
METTTLNYDKWLEQVIPLAKCAGDEIMRIYEGDEDLELTHKFDDSPLTIADLRANDIIVSGLKAITPEVPVLSEEMETVDYKQRSLWDRYWLIDPLDGTNEFLEHSGQFTVNIALIDNHRSVLGVSYAPALKKCYYARLGSGAYCLHDSGDVVNIKTRKARAPVDILVSKRLKLDNLEPFLQSLQDYNLTKFGGSLKLCYLAEGGADVYPRLGKNCEWDTAAGQIIVEEAGGLLVDLDFKALRYNTKESLYNPYFMVIGDKEFPWQSYLEKLRG